MQECICNKFEWPYLRLKFANICTQIFGIHKAPLHLRRCKLSRHMSKPYACLKPSTYICKSTLYKLNIFLYIFPYLQRCLSL